MARMITEAQREAQWQIERDSRILRDYAEVSTDSARMEAAKKYLEEEQEKLSKAIGLKTALTEHYAKGES